MKADVDELKEKRFCNNCTEELYLKSLIEKEGLTVTCSYCGGYNQTFSLEEIANLVDRAFEIYYVRTSDYDQWNAYGGFDRDGDPVVDVIAEAVETEMEPAEDIRAILQDTHYDHELAQMSEEGEFDTDSYYQFKGPNPYYWHSEWATFENALKTKSRFYNSSASEFLSSIFTDISLLKTSPGHQIILDGGPNAKVSALYRARTFQSNKKLAEALERPDLHIGTPPSDLSRAGRMNAKGISVFYGSSDKEVALAEVRPPVGSRVAIAKFNIIRPIKLLDLEALAVAYPEGTIFEEKYGMDLAKAAFLRSLCNKITQPVMPDDEDFEYLATQTIADYLANTENPGIDGIKFKSSQSEDTEYNVVLFHKASKVEDLVIGEDAKLEVGFPNENEESGLWLDYTVREIIPKKKSNLHIPKNDHWDFQPLPLHNWDERIDTLKVDVDDIEVKHVRSIQLISKPYKVQRNVLDENVLPDE